MSPQSAGSWLGENSIKVGNSHSIQVLSAGAVIKPSPRVGNARIQPLAMGEDKCPVRGESFLV